MRWLLLVAPLAACTEPSAPFPEGFRWGTATAGFQVDMGCPTWSDDVCLDTASDWYQWVTTAEIAADPDLHTTGEDVRNGPGMWETFEQDVARMEDLRLNAYRMSFEWSRLFPDAAARQATSVDELVPLADPEAVARYHEQLDALDAAGIEVMVTLNHYTLPLWQHDGVACNTDMACATSGWLDPDIVDRIALYAGFCGREFGGKVDRWATQNEPFANTLAGYVQPNEFRVHPPGRSLDGQGAVASLFHQIEAHATMYDQVHAEDTVDADGDGTAADVGIVLNLVAAAPLDPNDADDIASVQRLDHMYHRLFLDGLTAGDWDSDADGTFDQQRPELADRLDWVGVNYYNRVLVNSLGDLQPLPEVPALNFLPTVIEEPFPEGLGEVLDIALEYDRPVWITEVGTAFAGQRVSNVDALLAVTHDRIESGADIRGFYYWSWVDNYEWNHGLALQFGIHGIGPDKERQPRAIAERLSLIARRNGLP